MNGPRLDGLGSGLSLELHDAGPLYSGVRSLCEVWS